MLDGQLDGWKTGYVWKVKYIGKWGHDSRGVYAACQGVKLGGYVFELSRADAWYALMYIPA